MATTKNNTNNKPKTYTAPKYTAPTYTQYQAYTPYKTYVPMTDPNAVAPKTTKVTKVAGATNAVNKGVGYLNQLDQNLGGLYGNSAGILIDNGAVQAYENARKNSVALANRQYDDNANTYYQMYKQNTNKLPENLSRLGVTGGASETAALGLLNNYSGNLYQNESARANALNETNMRYDELVAQNSADIARTLADMYYNIGSGYLAEQRAKQRADFEFARDAGRSDYEWNRNLNRSDYEWRRDANRSDFEWNRNTNRSDYEYKRDSERDDFLRDEQYRREDYVRQQEYDREDATRNYDRALQQAQYTGNFSVMKQFGWSKSDINKANRLFANGNSGGSGGSSGGGSGRRYYSGYSGGYGSGSSGIDYLGVNGTDSSTTSNTSSNTSTTSNTSSNQGASGSSGSSKGKSGKSSNTVKSTVVSYINTLTNSNISDAKRTNTANALASLLTRRGNELTPEEYNRYWGMYLKYRKGGVNTTPSTIGRGGGGANTNALANR